MEETVEVTLSSWRLMLIGFLVSTVDKTYLEKDLGKEKGTIYGTLNNVDWYLLKQLILVLTVHSLGAFINLVFV